jgi:putative acetyltransferase
MFAVMLIRAEEPTDIADIRNVVEEAFPKPLEAWLVDQLRADGSSVISLVAVDGGKIVGHVQFSNMVAPFRALGLGPVSVMPYRQRSGIGSQMVRAGLKHAADAGWEGVFVLGIQNITGALALAPTALEVLNRRIQENILCCSA